MCGCIASIAIAMLCKETGLTAVVSLRNNAFSMIRIDNNFYF